MASQGEELIAEMLDRENLSYTREYSFKDLKSTYRLRYDFYIPEYYCLIEVDGTQHEEETSYFSQGFEIIQARDIRKNQYAIENGLKLIRIPYGKLKVLTSSYLARKIKKNVYGIVIDLSGLIRC